MTDDTERSGSSGSGEPEPDWKRKARLARVFGDVLPDSTRDDREDVRGDDPDAWLKSQVPPHHGG